MGETLVDGPMRLTLRNGPGFDYVPPTLERSGSVSIEPLRDRHRGQTAYLVGKGPSLARVRASDFGPGPVITINDAIRHVQALGLPNYVYSMQKEGCLTADPETIPRPCGSCEAHGWKRDPVIDPAPGIAVVFAQHFASWCLHGRPNRFVFTDAELGYPDQPGTMSVLEAIPLARHMGAASIVMVAFDSLATGDLGYVNEAQYTADEMATLARNLEWVRPRVLAALDGIPHSFYSPRQA